MARSARMSDVAKLAGVSIMTVSRVLNENPNVTEGMRRKVFATIEQLRYQPNELARSLCEQRSRQIGIIVPYLFDPFYAICAHAISTVAKEHSYSVVLSTSNEDPQTEFEEASRILRRNVRRLIVIPAHSAPVRQKAANRAVLRQQPDHAAGSAQPSGQGHPPTGGRRMVGFDDFETADLIRPGITVVRQPSDVLTRRRQRYSSHGWPERIAPRRVKRECCLWN